MAETVKKASHFVIHFLIIDVIFFIAFTLCFLANVNIENRGERILAMFFCMSGIWGSKFFLLTNYEKNKGNITFITSMTELGIFLNLYIAGFGADRTIWEILDYLFGIGGFLAVTLCIIAIQHLVSQKAEKRMNILVMLLILFAVWLVYGFPTDNAGNLVFSAMQLVKSVFEVTFICAFVAFFDGHIASFNVENLNGKSKKYFWLFWGIIIVLAIASVIAKFLREISLRNAILEILKVFLLLLFAVFFHDKLNSSAEISDNQTIFRKTLWLVIGISLTAFVVIGALASEFGTALILCLFTFCFILFVLSSMNSRRKERKQLTLLMIILSLISIGLYLFSYSVYSGDSALTIFLKNSGIYDKLDRLFNLSGNSQLVGMNMAINESPRFFVAMPYHVDIDGRIQTRVEDFSFMNIVTVFGSFLGIVLLILMITVPAKMIEKIRMKHTADNLYSIRNLFCMRSKSRFTKRRLCY